MKNKSITPPEKIYWQQEFSMTLFLLNYLCVDSSCNLVKVEVKNKRIKKSVRVSFASKTFLNNLNRSKRKVWVVLQPTKKVQKLRQKEESQQMKQ